MNGRWNCASLKQLTALSTHAKQTLRNFHVEQKPLTNALTASVFPVTVGKSQ